MATPFTKLNISFLGKITDTYLKDLDLATLEKQLTAYMTSAIPKFQRCKKNLSLRNNTEFTEDLSDEEVEILANMMVVEWLRPQVNNLELLRQAVGSKDFQMYSQANHLKELKSLRQDTQSEINKLLVDYSYNLNSLDDLTNG